MKERGTLMSNITELYKNRKYAEILNQYLDNLSQIKHSTKDPKKMQKNLDTLYCLLVACEQLGCYCDYLDVLKKIHEIYPLNSDKWNREFESLLIAIDFALESLLYCLYNNNSEKLGIDYNIVERIDKTIKFYNCLLIKFAKKSSDRHQQLVGLYEDYQNGNIPIYTVEYLYPFEPIVKDYVFDLSGCYPYITMEVKKVPRENDNYTSFKFKAYGMIKPDAFWMGPRWEKREPYPAIKKTLDITNMMLLQAVKASPGKIIIPYSINQVSTVSMCQYRGDGKSMVLVNTILSTNFQADLIGGNAQWHIFTDDEMKELNKRIVSTYKNEPFVTTFHYAMNLFSAGIYLEAFLLLCACCEGMVYYWCGEIAKKYGIYDEYNAFSQKESSKCDTCGEYKKSGKERPYGKQKPSLFANIAYLYEHKCITNTERKKISRLISKARNDSLRNRTVHGENNIITKREAEETYDSIMELQKEFRNIEMKKENDKTS